MGLVRVGGPADVPDVLRMIRHFYAEVSSAAWLTYDAEVLKELIRRVMGMGVVFLVDDAADQPCGVLAAVIVTIPFSGQQVAEELVWWVDPDARKTSAAERLRRAFETWAGHQHLRWVKVTAPVDANLDRYYRRCGYRPIETAYLKEL